MNKKKAIGSIFLVLLLVITLLGITYAVFTFSKVGSVENSITTGSVTMAYTDDDNQITINNAVPIIDEVGKLLSDENYLFDFTINIKIVGDATISYEITAEKIASSTMVNNGVKLYLQKSQDGINYDEEVLQPSPYEPINDDDEFGAKAGEMILDVGSTNKTVRYYYRLRMWVNQDYEVSNESKTFTIKVNAYGKSGSYAEKIKNEANKPQLVGDMIPVVYDESSSSWKKSNTQSGKWYDYDNQKWANVVTIKDATKRESYKNAENGTPIKIEDINTFMVWIPRYSYTLGNSYGYQIEGASTPSKTTPGAFDIKFVSKYTTDLGSGQYTGDIPKNYFTPSSFCWGDTCDDEKTRGDSKNKELSGIWVAKFEMTGTIDDISSLPSKENLRTQNLASLFGGVQSLMNGTSGTTNYGLSGTYDAHVIKNTEWGAFTYLSQSKYGKYGNKNYSGADKDIALNNCSNYITGIGGDVVYGSSTPTTCTTNTYQTAKGQAASTTGNIYGIYDAAGGGAETVMGNYNYYSGTTSETNSGFSGNNGKDNTTTNGVPFPSRKYYNLYVSTLGIKGDATNADGINEFYGHLASFVNSQYPWMQRSIGNPYGSPYPSIFSFADYSGTANSGAGVTTRFVCITR